MRIRQMGQKEIFDLLMEAMKDYLVSHDGAIERLEHTADREERIGWEKVIGQCTHRVMLIKDVLNDMTKAKTRDVLKQVLEDTLAAYENARERAEVAPLVDERTAYENIKGRCVKRKLLIQAALQELT